MLLAVISVFLAPGNQARFGTLPTMYAILALIALDLLVMGLGVTVLIVAVILGGGFLGVNNTLITTAVMRTSPVERPVASAAYSFIRFVGGAVAPLPRGEAC